eukprot:TRINITY_DN24116_c0_g1_i1.p1 TRINITY_DN24116_c0_g1~~TRINITY_DN24116_c0_g1_i1.p1  ORF type:complete len:449 (+),score=108.29 TRINITY_DN24116_c0_g1_i1:120-1349(+)
MSGEILEERRDLGCVQLAFSDGHKYWYPIKALTRSITNGKGVILKTEGKTIPDLMKAKLIDITRRSFGDKVDLKGFVKMRNYPGAREEEEWAIGVEALFKEISPQLDALSKTADQTRISDFQYTRRMGEIERDLSLAHKLIHKLQEERRVDFEALEASKGSPGGREDAALHEIIRLIRNENEELRMQLSSADQSTMVARKEAAELARQGKLLEDTLKEQSKSIEILKSELEEKRRRDREAPLLDFKALRETPLTKNKRRAHTPPARIAGNAGMRRAANFPTGVTPPTKRGPTFSVITATRSISPGNTGNTTSRTPMDGMRKITRSESLGTRGRKTTTARRTQSPEQINFGGVTITASNSGTHERPRRYERSHTTGSVRTGSSSRIATLPPPPPVHHDPIPTSRTLKYDV